MKNNGYIRVENTDANSFHKLVTESGKICITAHIRPDGDAIGSTVGLKKYIEYIGGHADIVLPSPANTSLGFMADGEDISIFSEDPARCREITGNCDLIVCCDCNGFSRTEGLESLFVESKAKKILIDHHLGPEKESFDLIFSDPEASSCSELLFWILLLMPEIDGDISRLPTKGAEALLTGMTTDTMNFSHSTHPSTFSMASKMLEAGIDRDKILDKLNNCYRENRLRVIGHMLGEEMLIRNGCVAYMLMDKRTQEHFELLDGETEGLVNMPLAIEKVRMSILAKEQDGYYTVSIRSKKGTSANKMARMYFHGGGHEQASGGKILFPEDISHADSSLAKAFIENKIEEFLTCEN